MLGLTDRVRFDRAAAILGLVAAVALLPVQLVVSHIYAQTIPVVLALGCVVYLLARDDSQGSNVVTMPTTVAHALPPVVTFGAAGLLYHAVEVGGRTQSFYLGTGVLGTLVLAQILLADDEDLNPGVILAQVLTVALALRLGAVLTTPGLIGIDVWTHVQQYTAGVISEHSISGMGETKYVMAPLYHLLVATTYFFTGQALRGSVIASVALVVPTTVVFVYMAGKYLVPTRWALFAAALFAVSGSAIRWGMHLLPTGLGLVFFVVALYFVMRLFLVETGLRDSLVLVLTFVAMGLTHQVSSFILLVFLVAGWVTQMILDTGLMNPPKSSAHGLGRSEVESISFGGYAVFNMGFLTLTWSLTPYYGRPFLETVLLFLQNAVGGSLDSVSGPSGSSGGQTPSLAQFLVSNFDVLGFLMLLFGTVVGSLYALHRDRTNQAILTLVVAGVVMTAFTLLPPIVGIGTFLSGRWFAFLYVVLAILTGVGLGHLRRGLSPTLMVVFLLVFLYAFPTVMIASPKGTVDQPVMETEQPRFAYTEEELAAVRTIGSVTSGSPEDPIATDFPYASVLNRYHSTRFSIATIPPNASIRDQEGIYRRYQTTGAPLFGSGEGGSRYYRIRRDRICPPGRDEVYANGDVSYCRA